MFEPENQIERDLMMAAVNAAARPAFARALLVSEVFVVLLPDEIPHMGPDGRAVIAAETTMTLATGARDDGVMIIPFFTAPSRARAWFAEDHVIAPTKARDLFAQYPDRPFFLNPGSDYGKEFAPDEVRRMLADEIDGEVVIAADTKVLLGHPIERPDVLVAALTKELTAVTTIRGAWLMLASIEGQREQSWMLGVDHEGDWSRVQEAVTRAVSSDVLKGRPIDCVPLQENSLGSTLRTGIPIVAADLRGFHN